MSKPELTLAHKTAFLQYILGGHAKGFMEDSDALDDLAKAGHDVPDVMEALTNFEYAFRRTLDDGARSLARRVVEALNSHELFDNAISVLSDAEELEAFEAQIGQVALLDSDRVR